MTATSAGTVTVKATIAGVGANDTDYTQNFDIMVSNTAPNFVPVTGITGVPTAATVGTPLTLTGTIVPSGATDQAITWSIASDGGTNSQLSGNSLTATATGTVTVKATIAGGGAGGEDYTQNFDITVSNTAPAFVPVMGITGVPTAATVSTPLELKGTIAPSNATNQTVTWSIITNNGGTNSQLSDNSLVAMAAGTVTVKATIAGGSTGGADYRQNFDISASSAASSSSDFTIDSNGVLTKSLS